MTIETFFWDKATGEPCPRRGDVLCDLPWNRKHRHTHEPPMTLTVVAGSEPVSALRMVEQLDAAARAAQPDADEGGRDE